MPQVGVDVLSDPRFWPNLLSLSEDIWHQWLDELGVTLGTARAWYDVLVRASEWNRVDDTVDDPAWLSVGLDGLIGLRLEIHPKGPICWLIGPGGVEVILADDIGGQGERRGLRFPELSALAARAACGFSDPSLPFLLLATFVSLESDSDRVAFEAQMANALANAAGLSADSAVRLAKVTVDEIPSTTWRHGQDGWYTDDPGSTRSVFLAGSPNPWLTEWAEKHRRDALQINRMLETVLNG